MIINFSIQNFGSVKDKQTLSFEATKSTDLEPYYIIEPVPGLRLLKLALIYGANASGKTTILKALDFLRDIVLNPEDKKTNTLDFNPFLFDEITPKQNSILSLDFIQNQVRYLYEVEFSKKAIVREELNFFKSKANIFKRTTDLDKQFTEITFGGKIKKDKIFEKVLEANTLWNNTVLAGFFRTNIENKELKEVTDWFLNYLKPLIHPKTLLDDFITSKINTSEIKKENVVEILKKADFNISDIAIHEEKESASEGFKQFLEKQLKTSVIFTEDVKNLIEVSSIKLEFEHTLNNSIYQLPFDLESQGTKRYYGFAGLLSLLIQNAIVFPIDELETSLHPDLFNHFILSFIVNAKNSQILATTHNREILNNKDIFRNDVIWFTDKTAYGATELYALSDFDTKVIRDTTSVYNAYKIGKLGAVPHLGDYFIDIADETN